MFPTKIKIPKVEFYITNVCNLTCENCNRFNNHNFKGWQRWSDYESLYEEWSKYVDIDHIVIMGGEPTLNSTLSDWIKGINTFWKKNVQILSNGTRLSHLDNIYKILVTTGNWLGISWHNNQTLDELFLQVESFLHGNIIKKIGKENTENTGADFMFIDDNNVKLCVWIQDEFGEAAVKVTPTGFTIEKNNNPQETHNTCNFVQNKCYHFIKGKLYKCGPSALLSEFDDQHHFENITQEERDILHSYKPITIDDVKTKGAAAFDNIDEMIPHCQYCKEAYGKVNKINPTTKGKINVISE